MGSLIDVTRYIASFAFAIGALMTASSTANAAAFVVNTNADSQDIAPGDGFAIDANGFTSLRAAIMECNALGPGPHTITFQVTPFPVTYPITIIGAGENACLTGDLDISCNLTIVGNGALNTTIDGSNCPLPPCPGHDRVFHILGGSVEFRDLRITRGYAVPVEFGGGVFHDAAAGDLRLLNVELIDNHAAEGGSIYISGSPVSARLLGGVTVSNSVARFNGGGVHLSTGNLGAVLCDINNNSAVAEDGGGIYTAIGTNLNIADSQIVANKALANQGGGVCVDSSATFTQCLVLENTAALAGGIRCGGTTLIVGCQIIGNGAFGPPLGTALGTAGGGVYHNNFATSIRNTTFSANVVNSQFPDDSGGGLAVGPIGIVDVADSTFNDNLAGGLPAQGLGGGVANYGQLSMVNSTISTNLSRRRGGGLYNFIIADTQLSHVTIAQNKAEVEGAGIYFDNPPLASGAIQLISTLIAENLIPQPFPNPPLPQNYAQANPNPAIGMTSAGHNFDTDGTANLFAPGDICCMPSFIGGLTLNPPGQTATHGLFPGSPAIDAADPPCSDLAGNVLMLDQRGALRPEDGDGNGIFICDIGAYELAPAVLPPPNNDCAQAAPIAPGQTGYTTLAATTDGPLDPCFTGLPGQDGDIWFHYVSPCHGITNLTLGNGSFDQLLSVYDTVCPQAGGVFIGCMAAPAGQSLSLTLPPHGPLHAYIIRIGGVAGQQGMGTLDITVSCTCPADIAPPPAGNGIVNVADLLAVIGAWGACPPGPCSADIAPPPSGNGVVNVQDLLAVIGAWGTCP